METESCADSGLRGKALAIVEARLAFCPAALGVVDLSRSWLLGHSQLCPAVPVALRCLSTPFPHHEPPSPIHV